MQNPQHSGSIARTITKVRIVERRDGKGEGGAGRGGRNRLVNEFVSSGLSGKGKGKGKNKARKHLSQ